MTAQQLQQQLDKRLEILDIFDNKKLKQTFFAFKEDPTGLMYHLFGYGEPSYCAYGVVHYCLGATFPYTDGYYVVRYPGDNDRSSLRYVKLQEELGVDVRDTPPLIEWNDQEKKSFPEIGKLLRDRYNWHLFNFGEVTDKQCISIQL
jgi:hypothetical protein